ncbi:MAG: restriction system-associated AAA family ATPase [Bacteroidia bacterium]|nr:restriction system-associated AAA family ATPase [Bacteroidia bacterium]
MKLRRLKLENGCRYRSLEAFDEEKTFPKHPDFKDEIDPICLMGLNGCGKSNLLELLSDIFFILDSYLLKEMGYYKAPSYFPFADNRKRSEIYFMIEYEIKVAGENKIIKIIRTPPKSKKRTNTKPAPIFQYRDENKDYQPLELAPNELRKYIPKVIAYTSGGNELISLAYTEMQDNYGRLVTNSAKNDKSLTFDLPKIMFLDYDINPAIVIANYLFASKEKLALFKSLLRVDNLDSFRIQVKTEPTKGSDPIILTEELENIIQKLTACATCYTHKTPSKTTKKGEIFFDYWTLDFVVTDATRQAFLHYFGSAKELFYAFYKLNLLNTLCIKKEHREDIKRKRKQGIFMKFPTVSDLDKIFNISKVDLVLSTPKVITEYIKISDGEHQFIHIAGGMLLFDSLQDEEDYLFLMDEPDTHFNPYWRRRFFKELNQVVENKEIEMIITTHSPFIVSDCHGYNVFKFQRVPDGTEVKFTRSHMETYGASEEDILTNLFLAEHADILSKSEEALKKIAEEIDTIQSIEEVYTYRQKIQNFGSSIHKLHALVAIDEKEQEITQKT